MDTTPKRRWLRFSLRTLMLLVTIGSAGFGWLGVKVRAKQREREAVKAIQELGGSVVYDYQMDLAPFTPDPVPPGPQWLRRIVGDDFFTDAASAGLGNLMSETDLRQVAKLNQLQELSYCGPLVTDAALVHLQGLNQLEWLDLHVTNVTDAGLVELKQLTKLRKLILCGAAVTDAGVEELQRALPNLEIDR